MSGGWTKGPWTIGTDTQPSELCTIHGLPTQPTEDGKGQTWVYIHHPRVIDREWYWPTPEEKLRSAELIIEAGTVANETGLTPRQLADQRAELLEIAKIFLGHDERFIVSVGGNPNAVDQMLSKARDAIAKATAS